MDDKNGIIPQKINVFKNRNYSLLFWGIFVSNVAHVIFNFAISLFLLRIAEPTYGEENAGLIQAIYLAVSGIVMVLLIPFGGVLADKLNKVRTMYITDYIRGLTIILAGVAMIFDWSTLIKIIILFAMNIILSINSAFFTPSSSSLLRFVVKDEELQPAASLLQGSNNLQAIIGLILGGILYSILDIHWIFILNGGAYILSAISEMFIKYNHHEHTNTDKMTIQMVTSDIKDGLKYLLKEKAIVAILFMALALNFFVNPLFSNAMPYFIQFKFMTETTYVFQNFLSQENWYSIISVAFSVSAIIMSLILSRGKTKDSYSKSMKVSLVSLVMGFSGIAITMILYYADILSINIVLFSLTTLMFAIGLSNIAFNIPISMVMQRRVERNMLGKVSSVSTVLSQALIPISSLIAGLIIAKISISALYAFCLIGMIITTFLFVRSKASNEI